MASQISVSSIHCQTVVLTHIKVQHYWYLFKESIIGELYSREASDAENGLMAWRQNKLISDYMDLGAVNSMYCA